MPKRVLLGMSGGVDSSVSAILLLQQGYEVIGAFMKNWSGGVCKSEEKNANRIGDSFVECGWKNERRDAMRVASQLEIPFVTFDFESSYREKVVEDLFEQTKKGKTPNPDILCNKYVKFDLFFKEAEKLGCDFVATGHYARIKENTDGTHEILKGIDENKDQTYFLWAIDKKVLPKILFPIGDLSKPVVREIAKQNQLIVAQKKDSVGICFVGEVEMKSFLQERISKHSGDVMLSDGRKVGEHEGVEFYTIGQRHGLNIGGGEPYFVLEKDIEKNILIVGGYSHPMLFKKTLKASNLNWFTNTESEFHCDTRIRHRQPVQKCFVKKIDDHVVVEFSEAQRAITPGQSIVFYQDDVMLGGGIID